MAEVGAHVIIAAIRSLGDAHQTADQAARTEHDGHRIPGHSRAAMSTEPGPTIAPDVAKLPKDQKARP